MLHHLQCIRNFELTFRPRQNSVFYFSAETGGKHHRRTEWAEYFSKQPENQFFCSRPRVTGLLNICTRTLYCHVPNYESLRKGEIMSTKKQWTTREKLTIVLEEGGERRVPDQRIVQCAWDLAGDVLQMAGSTAYGWSQTI